MGSEFTARDYRRYLRHVHMSGRIVSASLEQRGSHRKMAAWSLTIVGPALLTVICLPFRDQLGLGGFLMLTLLLVIAIALIGGVWPAVVTVGLGFVAGAIFFAPPYDSLSLQLRLHNAPLIAYLIVGAVLGLLVDDLATVAKEQAALREVDAALRRVATLVARSVPTDELFAATTEEVGRLLGVARTSLVRLEAGGESTVIAQWSEDVPAISPGLVDSDVDRQGVISAPIIVEARTWGSMTANTGRDQTPDGEAQVRLARFTELLATAIANAQNRDELAASRARIVAASDHTRRQIERDLHDGAQQRLVSLTLGLRTAQRTVPPELPDLQQALSSVAEGLAGVMEELREMARGIHPAVLAEGGIGPALGNLARRSPIPVELDLEIEGRLPEQAEVAVYYVVAESLTNIVKHADASTVAIRVNEIDRVLRVSIQDDGAGGADPRRGTGLTGLRDRVQALGGTIDVQSPPGGGTRVQAELPISA
jgi:signal transduction histidine kinase